MVKARIYLEGGGDKQLDIKCREGFNKLLMKCGFERRMPKLTACGARDSAYSGFTTAHAKASSGDYIVLLVDSEDFVEDVNSPWAHLNKRDRWAIPPGATDEQVLLMATCMETWIVADRDSLSSHYGQCLQASALPATYNLESRDRKTVQNDLSHATQNCTGPYQKGKKSYELLGEVNPDAIEPLLPSFKRARVILDGKLQI